MKAKAVIITDLHFSKYPNGIVAGRSGEFADILLLRTVHRLNRYIKPDIVFIGGDLLDNPDDEDRETLLEELKKIISLIDAPVVVIRGNHDPEQDIFEGIIGKQADYLDIKGIRFVPFSDPESPGYNAFRTKNELKRMRKLGNEFDGPLISLQHVPLFPSSSEACAYNYTNADEIVSVMRETGYTLALSGHYHEGFELLDYEGVSYIAGRSLCDQPFIYTVIEIDHNGRAACHQEKLAMPPELCLVDHHVHTGMAYCNENMDIAKSINIGKIFGLDGIVISEHSAHLYFNKEYYGQRLQYFDGLGSDKKSERVKEYFQLYADEANDFCRLGMEIDYDKEGRAVIAEEVWNKLQFRNGSVHVLDIADFPDIKKIEQEFLYLTEAVAASGVDVLVHPFRIFKRRGLALPEHLFGSVVEILKRHGTAVEINYHTNEPPSEFFRMCIESGIKLSLGSDAHNLYEVGEFYPHLKFLKAMAPDRDINDLLLS